MLAELSVGKGDHVGTDDAMNLFEAEVAVVVADGAYLALSGRISLEPAPWHFPADKV
jgi:hypothetical protein